MARLGTLVGVGIEDEDEEDGKVYKRWKIGNIGYNVGQQRLKWQQIGNTIGNKSATRSATIGNILRPKLGLPPELGLPSGGGMQRANGLAGA